MSLIDAYQSWRHGRGFGVHSPFAFRMVSEVLRLPSRYAFYAYADIASERVRLRAPLRLDEAFLIFRVVNALQPGCVIIFARGALERLLVAIVHSALPHVRIARRLPQADAAGGALVIAFDAPGATLPAGCSAYLAGSGMECLPGAMPFGQIYRNRSRAVVAALPHLPFQQIHVRF